MRLYVRENVARIHDDRAKLASLLKRALSQKKLFYENAFI